MTETQEQHTQAPDEAASWYNERRTDSLRQVESQLNELATFHSQLETTWSTLDERENAAHDALDTRLIVSIQNERQHLLNEAQKVQNGYGELQKQKQYLEAHTNPEFSEVLSSSGPQAQLFLRTFKHKLQDPDSLRRLMLADARATAVGLKPGSTHWAKSLEAAMGFDSEDRSLDDFNELSDEMQQARNATKREPKAQEPKELTAEQASIAKDLGITSDEYAASMKNPFSEASQAIGDESKEAPIEVKFEQEKPTRKTVDPAKYKPGPQSMTLTPAQVRFCQESGIEPKEYVKNALAVNKGETTHQWYDARLKSQGLA